MARREVACVIGDSGCARSGRGIVRARDSAKMPPPQPMSRYCKPGAVVELLVPSFKAVLFCKWRGGASAKQDAIKSCRSGFIRWRGRDGPTGSHQLLARAEKCESSSADTDEEEWFRMKDRAVSEGL